MTKLPKFFVEPVLRYGRLIFEVSSNGSFMAAHIKLTHLFSYDSLY